DGAVEMGIERTIHDAHTALTELGIDPVMAKRLADHKRPLAPPPNRTPLIMAQRRRRGFYLSSEIAARNTTRKIYEVPRREQHRIRAANPSRTVAPGSDDPFTHRKENGYRRQSAFE